MSHVSPCRRSCCCPERSPWILFREPCYFRFLRPELQRSTLLMRPTCAPGRTGGLRQQYGTALAEARTCLTSPYAGTYPFWCVHHINPSRVVMFVLHVACQDFYVEMKWSFSAAFLMAPLMQAVAPSDTYRYTAKRKQSESKVTCMSSSSGLWGYDEVAHHSVKRDVRYRIPQSSRGG